MYSNTPPSPNSTLPPAYSNWLSATEQHCTFLRNANSAALPPKSCFKQRCCLTSTSPAQFAQKIATRQADSYLLEKSRDGVTRTEARHSAEAPRRPLGGGHGGGEPSDLEWNEEALQLPLRRSSCLCRFVCLRAFVLSLGSSVR